MNGEVIVQALSQNSAWKVADGVATHDMHSNGPWCRGGWLINNGGHLQYYVS